MSAIAKNSFDKITEDTVEVLKCDDVGVYILGQTQKIINGSISLETFIQELIETFKYVKHKITKKRHLTTPNTANKKKQKITEIPQIGPVPPLAPLSGNAPLKTIKPVKPVKSVLSPKSKKIENFKKMVYMCVKCEFA